MSAEEDDPLEELVVDRRRVSKERVADGLDGILNIDSDGGFLTLSGFQELNSKRRIVALLLGQWVSAELEMSETASMEVEDVSASVGLSGSTVRKYLDELEFVRPSDRNVGFRIPENRLLDAVEYLSETATKYR